MNFPQVRNVLRLVGVKYLHEDASDSPQAGARVSAFSAAKAIVVLAIAVTLGLIGTGGTYAYLNASAPVTPGQTLTAGTAALTIGAQPLNWTALAPGKSATGTFTITNTGNVPLVLSATIAANMTPATAKNPFTVWVANSACPTSGVPTGNLNSTLAAGATTSACLAVTLPANAPANAHSVNAAIVATILGTQP